MPFVPYQNFILFFYIVITHECYPLYECPRQTYAFRPSPSRREQSKCEWSSIDPVEPANIVWNLLCILFLFIEGS